MDNGSTAGSSIPPPKVFYINYFDVIDPIRVKVLMAMVTEIVNKEKPDVLYFLFASNGGNVDSGIVLYNFLKSLPVKVVMHNTGVIDSIANVIFMAGSERYAAKHSSFLFHGIGAGFAPNVRLTVKQVRERVSGLESDENKIAGILCENSKLTREQVTKYFDSGEAVSVDFAKTHGVIHEIKDPSVPKGAPLMTVNINVNVQ